MIRGMRVGPCSLVILAACGEVPAAKIDAAIDAELIPDATTQCAELVAECAGTNVLRECTTVGEPAVDTTCDLGCSTDGGAHCRSVQPSFLLQPADLKPTAGLAEITLSATSTINVNDGSITNLRTAGTGIIAGIDFNVRDGVGIFRFQKLTITGGTPAQSLTFAGTNAVALVAITSIESAGTIFNVQGSCTTNAPGPGGGAGGIGGNQFTNGGAAAGTRGGKGGEADPNDGDFGGGGGGGGHAGNGGPGATGNGFAGGAGGMAESTVTFKGGGGGGGGAGGEDIGGGSGGGGGGALHLTANLLVKIMGGGVQAGGCGGNPGVTGGGGGAGGIIVLEANDVEIGSATLAANGGGGAGTASNGRGTHGLLGTTAASGGTGTVGSGGSGSSSTVLNGLIGSGTGGYGGGGGGAGGRIVLKSGDGLLTTGGAVFSPASTMNGIVPIN